MDPIDDRERRKQGDADPERSPSADRPVQGRTGEPQGTGGKSGAKRDRAEPPSLTQSGGEPRRDRGGPKTTREPPDNTNVESE